MSRLALLAFAALPLSAQAWDLRVEVPFAKGQNLPSTAIQGTGLSASYDHDSGNGLMLTLSHRIVRVGPVLKLELNAEATRWTANGNLHFGVLNYGGSLRQQGFGLGVTAQFWVPFTGLAGELGVIQRLQNYQLLAAGFSSKADLSRTWLRAGLRFRLPLGAVSPYATASYQQPLSPGRPHTLSNGSELARYLPNQGTGAEFDRLWTCGVGIQF